MTCIFELEAEAAEEVGMSEHDAKQLEKLVDDLFNHVTRHRRIKPIIGGFLDESVEKWSKGKSVPTINNLRACKDCFLQWTPPQLKPGLGAFVVDDFLNLKVLSSRLIHSGDPLARYVWEQMPRAVQLGLASQQSSTTFDRSLLKNVALAFNSMASGQCIYEVDRFKGVTLSKETLQRAADNPQGESCRLANRLLLEEGFKQELSRGLRWKGFSFLTPELYDDYFNYVRLVRPGSFAMRYGFQKRFIKRAMNMGFISSNPVVESNEAKVKPPKRDKEPGLTDEELELTYAYLDKAIESTPQGRPRSGFTKRQLMDFRGMMIVEEGTGARLNDLCALRLSNIDKESTRLHFVAHKSGKKHNIQILEPLWDHINSMDPSDDPDPPLFKSWYRPPGAGASNISNAFSKMFTAAGIRKPGRLATSRCFRRRVATEVGKVNPVAAQGLLGHSKIDTTTIYIVGNQKDVDDGSSILKTRAVAGRKKQPAEVRPDSPASTDPDHTGISKPAGAAVVTQHATDTESPTLGK